MGDPSWLSLAVCSVTHTGARCSPKHVLFMVNNKRNQSGEKKKRLPEVGIYPNSWFIWLMAAIHQLELCIVCMTLTVRQILINSLFSPRYIIYNDFLWKSNRYILYCVCIAYLTLTVNELQPSTVCWRIHRPFEDFLIVLYFCPLVLILPSV